MTALAAMKCILRLIGVTLIWASAAFAGETNSVIKGKVLEFGTYRTTGGDQKAPAGKTAATNSLQTIEFLAHGTNVVAKKGVSFGFTYQLSNLPTNGPALLTLETLHPMMIVPNGTTNYGSGYHIIAQSSTGVLTDHIGYRLNEDYQFAEGNWTFSILSLEGKTIASKTFHLTKH